MTLEPEDYWKLRTLNTELEKEQTTLALVQSRLESVRNKRTVLWNQLAEKYHFDSQKNYTANDEDCSINGVERQQ